MPTHGTKGSARAVHTHLSVRTLLTISSQSQSTSPGLLCIARECRGFPLARAHETGYCNQQVVSPFSRFRWLYKRGNTRQVTLDNHSIPEHCYNVLRVAAASPGSLSLPEEHTCYHGDGRLRLRWSSLTFLTKQTSKYISDI